MIPTDEQAQLLIDVRSSGCVFGDQIRAWAQCESAGWVELVPDTKLPGCHTHVVTAAGVDALTRWQDKHR